MYSILDPKEEIDNLLRKFKARQRIGLDEEDE